MVELLKHRVAALREMASKPTVGPTWVRGMRTYGSLVNEPISHRHGSLGTQNWVCSIGYVPHSSMNLFDDDLEHSVSPIGYGQLFDDDDDDLLESPLKRGGDRHLASLSYSGMLCMFFTLAFLYISL